MKILILSDIHLEFAPFAADSRDADLVILAGDIHLGDKGIKWAIETFKHSPVLYILGNHEYYRQVYPKLVYKLKVIANGTNITILENESKAIDGVTFFGCTLWTDFKLFGNPKFAGRRCQQNMNDFHLIRREPHYSKLRTIDVAAINRDSVNWLSKEFERINCTKSVVITHHAPSLKTVSEKLRHDILNGIVTLSDWRENTDMNKSDNPYYRHRFPPEVISHAVWLYHRFTLSFRDIEEILAIRGIQTSYESIRRWCLKFPRKFTKSLRKRQGKLGDISEPQTCARNYRDSSGGCVASSTCGSRK